MDEWFQPLDHLSTPDSFQGSYQWFMNFPHMQATTAPLCGTPQNEQTFWDYVCTTVKASLS